MTQYCELYNPKAWEQLGNAPALQDVYGYIIEKQATVVVSLQGITKRHIDLQASNVITIMLAHNGTLLLNNTPLMERSKLAEAVQSKIRGYTSEDFEFYVYLDEGSNGAHAPEVFETLIELGVKSIEISK